MMLSVRTVAVVLIAACLLGLTIVAALDRGSGAPGLGDRIVLESPAGQGPVTFDITPRSAPLKVKPGREEGRDDVRDDAAPPPQPRPKPPPANGDDTGDDAGDDGPGDDGPDDGPGGRNDGGDGGDGDGGDGGDG